MTSPIISRDDARSAGLKRFFTAVACFRGHQCERLVSNGLCIECARINKAADRARNFERERERKKRYLASVDPTEERIKARARYEKNKHAYKVKKNDPANYKKWRLANLDVVKRLRVEYKKNNRERFQAYDRNRRARKSQSAGRHTAKEVRQLYEKQRGKCASCGVAVPFKSKHIDHVQPLCAGGRNDISNLQILCAPCNLSKGSKDPVVWAQQLGRLI